MNLVGGRLIHSHTFHITLQSVDLPVPGGWLITSNRISRLDIASRWTQISSRYHALWNVDGSMMGQAIRTKSYRPPRATSSRSTAMRYSGLRTRIGNRLSPGCGLLTGWARGLWMGWKAGCLGGWSLKVRLGSQW